ncbi:MAG: Insulinase (Peptidase M16) [Vezdaea aestivalis]|nr:MAG: Insulinase (Peptidase M16) [Vezdaea aestivalis]
MPHSSFSAATSELVTDQLEVPSLDDRSYRIIRLPNKLEVLLVHDKETDKASAALDVGVGNFSDPKDMPGVAHAVEHALFMGTEKYPVENEYGAYLSSHNGYTNAYTSTTHTNFFFEISALPVTNPTKGEEGKSALEGAVDRFAQFFIAPLFLENTLDRELRAVDSENKKNLQSDYWRLNQLSKLLSNPKHPYCQFSTGNLETLRDNPKEQGINVRDVFMDFHRKNYSANRMKLVLLGRESLAELEEWAVKYFSDIKNKDLPENRWDDVKLLTGNELQIQYFAKPVMESRTLEIYFPYPDEDTLFETQPSRYLSHLIGHEGPGSILAYIKAKGWANTLDCGGATICPGTGVFSVHARLTPEGLKNYPEVVKVVFQYIAMLREAAPQEWILNEMKGIAEVDFRFRQKIKASKFASSASSLMQKPYPRERLLSAGALVRRFDPEAIRKALDLLTPETFRMAIISQDFPIPVTLDKKEQWYGTEFHAEPIPAEMMAEFKKAASISKSERIPELFLHHKNEFIPEDLEVQKKVVENPTIAPALIRNDTGSRIWWKKDDRFWVPKAKVSITLRNGFSSVTPSNLIKTALYCELVDDALNEYAYAADLAGLAFELSLHPSGIDLELGGYSDKMPVLLEKVLLTMRDLTIDPQRFEIIKERIHRSHRNFDFQQPYEQVSSYMSWLNSPTAWINADLLAEIPSVTAKDVQEHFPLLLRHVHLELLCHGNLRKEATLKMASLVESILKPRPLAAGQWAPRRSFLLPEGANLTFARKVPDPENVNNAIEYVLSVGSRTDRALQARINLLAQMSHEPAFDQLRTKEQLGYVVFALPWASATRLGYKIIIQSERSAEYLEGRIEAFLADYEKKLEEMSDEEFEGHKASLINRRKEKPRNLGHESDVFLGHVLGEYFDFDFAAQEIAQLTPLKKSDLQSFYKQYISPSSTTRSKLSVHLCAQRSASPPPLSSLPSLLCDFLQAEGFSTASPDALAKRFEALDLTKNAEPAIVEGTRTYLKEDLGTEDVRIQEVLEKGRAMIGGLGLESTDQSKDEAVAADKAPAVMGMEDVAKYKAGLKVSEAAAPVVELETLMEGAAKL